MKLPTKSFLEAFCPDAIQSRDISELSCMYLIGKGLKGLVIDVDDTILSPDTVDVYEKVNYWIEDVRQYFSLVLLSNNLDNSRIQHIGNLLNLPCISDARKPSPFKLLKAIESMHIEPEETAMIGDRLFTDILAGNLAGMYTILVQKISKKDGKSVPHNSLLALESRLYLHFKGDIMTRQSNICHTMWESGF